MNGKYRYAPDVPPSAAPLGPIGPQLPPVRPYQPLPAYNITWQENPSSHVSFPEEVYSTDSDPYDILEENVASNQIDYAQHDGNGNDEISRNDNDEGNQVFVDGFWIKEGMQLFCNLEQLGESNSCVIEIKRLRSFPIFVYI